jgi:membrane-bound lytic murein transglycosylase D
MMLGYACILAVASLGSHSAQASHTSVFPVPHTLQSAVDFWKGLFLHHSSNRVVLHDREHMDIVWKVLELPQTPKTNTQRIVNDAVEELSMRLRRLALVKIPQDPEDDALLEAVGGIHNPRLEQAHTRIRAQRGVSDHFHAGYKRYQTWAPTIRKILKEEGVPVEMAALPFVESMFNPKARSSVGASGIWQLMPATARELGLAVSRRNDQRNDVVAATRAAARMLKRNFDMLGHWPLAVTAYNHGPYGVKRACEATGSTNLAHLIENYKKSSWGFASKNFYAEFLAASAILQDTASYEQHLSSLAASKNL